MRIAAHHPGSTAAGTICHVSKRLFIVLVMALPAAVLGLLAGPAYGADDTENQYVLDTDSVEMHAPFPAISAADFGEATAGGPVTGPGTLTWYRYAATGRLRAQLTGKARINQCGIVRAVWNYGDGSTSMSDTPTLCLPFPVPVDLDSLPGRDVLQVRIELRQRTEPLQLPQDMLVVTHRSERLMESGDGIPACSGFDVDRVNLSNGAGLIFSGSVTYRCDPLGGNDIRAHVTGTLFFNPAVPGTQTRLRVTSTLATGATSVIDSGSVGLGVPFRFIDISTPPGADVLRVRTAAMGFFGFAQLGEHRVATTALGRG